MFRIMVSIAIPLVFISVSWDVLKSDSANKLRDISKLATVCIGFLVFMSLKPSQMEALYPYFAGLFLLSAFTWLVSVRGFRVGVQKACLAVLGLLFAAWIRPDLFQWVLN